MENIFKTSKLIILIAIVIFSLATIGTVFTLSLLGYAYSVYNIPLLTMQILVPLQFLFVFICGIIFDKISSVNVTTQVKIYYKNNFNVVFWVFCVLTIVLILIQMTLYSNFIVIFALISSILIILMLQLQLVSLID